MKILALNSSPRVGVQSKTEMMLNWLVEGMREAGGDVEVVNLKEKKINNCIGCFTCWTKTPGRCIHKDDMSEELYSKWAEADLVVYATPLYYHTMNAAMSAFRERTLPSIQPFLEHDGEKTHHPLRHKVPPAVWLSVCGFPEKFEFDVLSDYLKRTTHEEGRIVAEIYRPGAESMSGDMYTEILADIRDATIQGGRELVRSMEIAPETMERISQPIGDTELFNRTGNLFWKTCIAEGVTPKQFHAKKMVPRPDSLESFMDILTFKFTMDAPGALEATVQFTFSGEVEDFCHFCIENGGATAHKGPADAPDVTVETPFELWMDIMTRKADGQQMFLEEKYKVHGDFELMLKLFQGEEEE